MAHPRISCIVYGTQNDNYHNQFRKACARRMGLAWELQKDVAMILKHISMMFHISDYHREDPKSIRLKIDWQYGNAE